MQGSTSESQLKMHAIRHGLLVTLAIEDDRWVGSIPSASGIRCLERGSGNMISLLMIQTMKMIDG